MKLKIHLISQSQPIYRENVNNAYTKDGLYCVLTKDKVEKFPLCNIFKIEEFLGQ